MVARSFNTDTNASLNRGNQSFNHRTEAFILSTTKVTKVINQPPNDAILLLTREQKQFYLSTTGHKPSIFQPQDKSNHSFNRRSIEQPIFQPQNDAIFLLTTDEKQSIFQSKNKRNHYFNRRIKAFIL
jgi:hypothetical protein